MSVEDIRPISNLSFQHQPEMKLKKKECKRLADATLTSGAETQLKISLEYVERFSDALPVWK
jgi:hypothetical protein